MLSRNLKDKDTTRSGIARSSSSNDISSPLLLLPPLGSSTAANRSKAPTCLETVSKSGNGNNKLQAISSSSSRSFNRKLNRRRRSSSSFVMAENGTSPMKDLSNIHCNSTPENKESKHDASKNKKRRSLCHVPFSVKESNSATSSKPSISCNVPPVQQDENKLQSSTHQRKKQKKSRRRQSILLPSDAEVHEFRKSTTNSEQKAGTKRVDDEPDSKVCPPAVAIMDSSAKDFLSMQLMVRKYCSLPKESHARVESAKNISELTGYPLSSHQSREHTEYGRPSRKQILMKVGPALEQTESRKHQQARKAEEATSCFVQKASSGKFQYIDTDGNKVSSEEYRSRYQRMIREDKKSNHQKFAKIRQELLLGSPTATRRQDEAMATQQPTQIAGVQPSVHLHAQDRNGVTVTESRDQASICSPDGADKPGELAIHNASTGSTKNRSTDDKGGTAPVVEVIQSTGQPGPSHAMQLPMNRDYSEESTDPEIAEAERRLWQAIDEALQTYSSDILAIQARRRVANGHV